MCVCVCQVGGDELNVGRTGKVVSVSGQKVEVMIKSKTGMEVMLNFKKTELALAPPEVSQRLKLLFAVAPM